MNNFQPKSDCNVDWCALRTGHQLYNCNQIKRVNTSPIFLKTVTTFLFSSVYTAVNWRSKINGRLHNLFLSCALASCISIIPDMVKLVVKFNNKGHGSLTFFSNDDLFQFGKTLFIWQLMYLWSYLVHCVTKIRNHWVPACRPICVLRCEWSE